MDFIEKITLSPFEKYVRFNRFPWKFILHLLLIALCTYQALRIVSIQDKHTRIQEQVFSTVYLQDEDGSSSFPFYSLTDYADAFFSVVNNTLNLNDVLLQYSIIDDVNYHLEVYYTHITDHNKDRMVVNGTNDSYLDQLQAVLAINPDDVAGFKTFLQGVENMELKITGLKTFISNSSNEYTDCLAWDINIGYSLQSLANVEATLEANSAECSGIGTEYEGESIVGIHFAIIIIASLSLFLSWRQVYFVSREYLYFKRKVAGSRSNSEEAGAGEMSQSRFRGHTQWQKNW
jgi:hypothetical protein